MAPDPALPVTDAAKKKIAAYRALVQPTGDTPGGYCLGTGMPGSMLGSGGYPMEIHQRPEQFIIIYEAHNETRRVYLGNRIVPEAETVFLVAMASRPADGRATRSSSRRRTSSSRSTSGMRIAIRRASRSDIV